MNVNFTETGWNDYSYWISQHEKKIIKRINTLIEDIERNRYDGIGKPEPLRNDLSGWWSRRIDDTHRLIYRLIDNDAIEISQCKGHYNAK